MSREITGEITGKISQGTDSEPPATSPKRNGMPKTGLDYFGARYYASAMGRFTSPDPITVTSARQTDPQQLNLYAYVRNNPLAFTDPSGMIINTDDRNKKNKAQWDKVVALANQQDADGNYVNPTLRSAYSALEDDARTFRIEDDM
jgi:RHS repeat-associated protein